MRMNLKPASKSSYFRSQKKDCANYARNILDGVILSRVGCWNHTRHGSSATVSIIDQTQEKVAAVSIFMKSEGSFQGNFAGPSNAMESAGFLQNITWIFTRISRVKILHSSI